MYDMHDFNMALFLTKNGLHLVLSYHTQFITLLGLEASESCSFEPPGNRGSLPGVPGRPTERFEVWCLLIHPAGVGSAEKRQTRGLNQTTGK